MNRLFLLRTIRSLVLWTHERGSVHYDVMVTLILAFIFLAPRWINFNDKPVERIPHPTAGVMVKADSDGGLIYLVDAAAVAGADDEAIRDSLRRVIEPVSGEIEILRYEPVRERGRLTAYRVWGRRY